MPAAKHEMLSDIDADSLMSVITDFPSYPNFLPEITKVDVRLKGPPIWEVRFELRMIRPIVYVLKLEKKNDFELSWSLIEGFFINNFGSWKLKEEENGLNIKYEISMQLDTFLPGSIASSLTKRSLPVTVERFVNEAKRRSSLQKSD